MHQQEDRVLSCIRSAYLLVADGVFELCRGQAGLAGYLSLVKTWSVVMFLVVKIMVKIMIIIMPAGILLKISI